MSGSATRTNAQDGIIIGGTSNGNQIGGTSAGDRNVISGNKYGVRAYLGSDSISVLGNYIGTDATGLIALGNISGGIALGVDRLVMLATGAEDIEQVLWCPEKH